MADQLRRFFATTYRVLSSNRVATGIMLAGLLVLLVWVAPFILYGVPSGRIQAIVEDELFTRVIAAALVFSTVLCIIPRMVRTLRRVTRRPEPGQTPRALGVGLELPDAYDSRRAELALASARIKRPVVTGEWAWGVRRPWALLGSLLFHLAIILLAVTAAIALTGTGWFQGEFAITETQTVRMNESSYIETSGVGPAPAFEMTLDSLDPRFHEDILLFTQLEGAGTIDGEPFEVAVGSPVALDPATQLALTDFGWSLELQGLAGEGATSTVVYDLKAFPSGTPDEFEYSPSEHLYRFSVQIYGDYVDRDGEPGNASFNADNPHALFSVWRIATNSEETLLVDSELVPVGGTFEILDDTVTVVDVINHGVFRVTRAPSRPLMILSLAIGLIGTGLRLLFPRADILLRAEQDGSCRLYVRSDVYADDERLRTRISAAWDEASRP